MTISLIQCLLKLLFNKLSIRNQQCLKKQGRTGEVKLLCPTQSSIFSNANTLRFSFAGLFHCCLLWPHRCGINVQRGGLFMFCIKKLVKDVTLCLKCCTYKLHIEFFFRQPLFILIVCITTCCNTGRCELTEMLVKLVKAELNHNKFALIHTLFTLTQAQDCLIAEWIGC